MYDMATSGPGEPTALLSFRPLLLPQRDGTSVWGRIRRPIQPVALIRFHNPIGIYTIGGALNFLVANTFPSAIPGVST